LTDGRTDGPTTQTHNASAAYYTIHSKLVKVAISDALPLEGARVASCSRL